MRRRASVAAALFLAACASTPAPPPATTPPPIVASPSVQPPLPPPPSDVVVRRTVVIYSRPSGKQVVVSHPDGSCDVTLEIVENGRGPKTSAHIVLAADRTIASLDASGHGEMHEPLDEHFWIDGGRASWKSTMDQGSKELSGPAFYYPLAPLHIAGGLLAEALVRAGDSLAILPSGEVRAERVEETTLVNAAGEKKHLVVWALLGLSLSPMNVWLDDAGNYWGQADADSGIVPEGWESTVASLQAEEKAIQGRRLEGLARKLAQRPPDAGLAIAHARVLDVLGKKWLPDQTVIIVGGKIKDTGPSRTTTIPVGAETIDATGKALIPGLWDMHAHVDAVDGSIYVASGVTTIRDVGNTPDVLDDLKRRYDEGAAIGPHILRAGLIEGRGPNAAGSPVTAETPEEARAAVEDFFRRGYVGIKIYNSVKPELVPIIAAAAHGHGMRVNGHVPVHMRAEEAVRAGYDELTHVNMLFLNFFADHDTDTRTLLRFTLVAEKASGLDLSSRPVRDFLALLRQKRTVVDPTLAVFEELFVDRPGEMVAPFRPVATRLPATFQRRMLGGGLPVPEGKDQTYKDAFTACLKLVRALYDQKTPLVFGTDLEGAGLALPHELELYVQAGIPAADVMQMATIGAARVMRVDKTTGSITPGKDADVVLLDGDPLKDVGDVRNVWKVVRGGIVYDSAPLFETAGIAPASLAAP